MVDHCSSLNLGKMVTTTQAFLSVFAVALAVICHPLDTKSDSIDVSNSATSLTFIYQNNLNASDDVNHVGAILLDSMTANEGQSACAALSETLLSHGTIQNYSQDFTQALAYLSFAGLVEPQQSYHIADGSVSGSSMLNFAATSQDNLPVLCTQSNNESEPPNSTATAKNQIYINAASNTYMGYRNQKSFRFLGIPYADPPKRWEYSTLYSGSGQTINATAYGSECTQAGGGSEDCLFLNIQTPYLPKLGSTKNLRPVMFWIHGGGFNDGSGADPLSDGGNLASREDIVVVNINYRVSTLGFLAIPGTDIKGNYGIADQIIALKVRLCFKFYFIPNI